MSYELAAILITVILQALYFAHKMGVIEKSISSLEQKQDKHNNLIERMVKAESNIKAIWHNLDDKNGRNYNNMAK